MQNPSELEKYYQKMPTANVGAQVKQINKSNLASRIAALVTDTEKLLEKERPWWNGDLWDERQIQIKILKAALKHISDKDLLVDCFFVDRYSNTTLILPSVYNDFVERLKSLLKNIDHASLNYTKPANNVYQQMVGRQNKPEEVQLDHQHEQLKEHVTNEIQKLRQELTKQQQSIRENEQKQVEAFERLVEELRIKNNIVEQYKKKYPNDYPHFNSQAEQQRINKKTVTLSIPGTEQTPQATRTSSYDTKEYQVVQL